MAKNLFSTTPGKVPPLNYANVHNFFLIVNRRRGGGSRRLKFWWKVWVNFSHYYTKVEANRSKIKGTFRVSNLKYFTLVPKLSAASVYIYILYGNGVGLALWLITILNYK